MTGLPPRYSRVRSALWRNAGDELLVLPRRGADCMSLSASARALWAALDEPRTAQEVCDMVSLAYGVTSAEIVADVRDALETLSDGRVVHRDPQAPG